MQGAVTRDRLGRVARPLTTWEHAVLRTLASVDSPGMAKAREAIDHLVVTSECGCGCGSFSVQDARRPDQPHELLHAANGVCGSVGFALFLGPDGAPAAVDVFLPDERSLAEQELPSPNNMTVTPA